MKFTGLYIIHALAVAMAGRINWQKVRKIKAGLPGSPQGWKGSLMAIEKEATTTEAGAPPAKGPTMMVGKEVTSTEAGAPQAKGPTMMIGKEATNTEGETPPAKGPTMMIEKEATNTDVGALQAKGPTMMFEKEATNTEDGTPPAQGPTMIEKEATNTEDGTPPAKEPPMMFGGTPEHPGYIRSGMRGVYNYFVGGGTNSQSDQDTSDQDTSATPGVDWSNTGKKCLCKSPRRSAVIGAEVERYKRSPGMYGMSGGEKNGLCNQGDPCHQCSWRETTGGQNLRAACCEIGETNQTLGCFLGDAVPEPVFNDEPCTCKAENGVSQYTKSQLWYVNVACQPGTNCKDCSYGQYQCASSAGTKYGQ